MKYVYNFREGNKDMKKILGGKGANLAEMTNLGLPVPKGFTITTEACHSYYENSGKIKAEIVSEILEQLSYLENATGKTFGGGDNPLLVSIRSGAEVSMPGMMDTILNLGLNDEVVAIMIKKTNNPRFVYDSYRRLIMMYADVVKNYPRKLFEDYLTSYKNSKGVTKDTELDAEDLRNITTKYKEIYESIGKTSFPKDARRQLLEAISAVFRSWNNERAIYYRKMNDISDALGTAVNIQEMVYGNIGLNSGTGVAFTRNPATGENGLYGEYLMNAQGEDVVAGIRTPEPISELKIQMPRIYEEFNKYAKILEYHYKDMQDMEFTIENSKLYMLQTRSGKRTPMAAIKVAVDMVKEKLIDTKTAILRIDPKQLENILHPQFNQAIIKTLTPITKGLAASPGAAVGKIYFTAKETLEATTRGEKVILVRTETSPEDIEGMNHAEGIMTLRGGMTSHAAVVARGMGRCCISGCENISIDEGRKKLILKNGQEIPEKTILSLDGTTGNIYLGEIPFEQEFKNDDFNTFMAWVDDARKMSVRANADNKRDALLAKNLGAEGIGLCRTEHMFFEPNRIFSFRKMILAETKEQRIVALNELLPYQRQDFIELFEVMAPNSVVIRYLDPPLHEFLPKTEREVEELSIGLNISKEHIYQRINNLKELNPMMGHRGCRLDVTYPEIAVMQTKAIIEAAITVSQKGIRVEPEIMLPLINDIVEFNYIKKIVKDTADKILKENQITIKYKIGSMIETPRACIVADELASTSEFFSFGTNDLTQLTYGFSRDDAGKFLNDYYKLGIMESDPFISIDQKGVGSLMSVACEISRKVNQNISLGICGEHAADLKSVEFCYQIGLDYVSCSPYRIPSAKLAAAQASIKFPK